MKVYRVSVKISSVRSTHYREALSSRNDIKIDIACTVIRLLTDDSRKVFTFIRRQIFERISLGIELLIIFGIVKSRLFPTIKISDLIILRINILKGDTVDHRRVHFIRGNLKEIMP